MHSARNTVRGVGYLLSRFLVQRLPDQDGRGPLHHGVGQVVAPQIQAEGRCTAVEHVEERLRTLFGYLVLMQPARGGRGGSRLLVRRQYTIHSMGVW